MTLDACGSPVAVTGTTSETTLGSVLLPAYLIGPHTGFRLWMFFSATNNANTKTVRARIGGTIIGNPASVANNVSHWVTYYGFCRGAVDSQVWWPSIAFGVSGGPVVPGSIDLSTDKQLDISVQLNNAGDLVTLEAYSLEILNASPR